MTMETGMGRTQRTATWVTTVLVAVAVMVAATAFLHHAGKIITFPYELAAGEELLLRDAVHMAQGRAVYTEINDFPFVVSNYPPLFAALSGVLVPLLGQSLAVTRLVATASTLLSGVLIGATIYQTTRSIWPSAVCGGVYLGSIFVYQWGAWGRVDSTAVLFSLLAVLVVLRWPDWRGTGLAAFCCLLSLYTKQTQWAAPLAIIAWLWWRRQRRHAVGFVVLLGTLGAVIFLLLNTATSGQFFRHLVIYNALGYSPRAFLSYWRAYLVTYLGIMAVATCWGARSLRHRLFSLPLLYFGVSVVTTVAVGRAGASSNYFLELTAAALILCGLCWSELAKHHDYASLAVPVILLLQLIWFKAFPLSPLAIYYDPLPSFGYTPQASDVRGGEEIDRHVEGVEGEVLTEGGGFALRNGKELYGSPWLLNALEETGVVDEGLARLEGAVAMRRFSLIILTWQSYPPRVLDAVWANYRRVDTVDCVFRYEIFVPREET